MTFERNDWQISISGSSARHTLFLSRRNAYILQKLGGNYENNSLNKCPVKNKNWTVWYWGDSHPTTNCVVLEYNKGLKLDIRFLSDANNGGKLEITLKTTDNKDISITDNLPALSSMPDLTKDKETSNVISKIFDTFDTNRIHGVIQDIMAKVEQDVPQNHVIE